MNTPQGDGNNLRIRFIAALRNVKDMNTPQGDGNLDGVFMLHSELVKDMNTPQGDGNIACDEFDFNIGLRT